MAFWGPGLAGLAVALFAWPIGGLLLAIVLQMIGRPLHKRWGKARWIKRFPELANLPDEKWRVRHAGRA